MCFFENSRISASKHQGEREVCTYFEFRQDITTFIFSPFANANYLKWLLI